ncbi:hypothetical protein GCM10009576_081480 [Streptomyces rhizosphaericus]|uniref:Uncharacterized protein n=3 Tax=Streptomyces TaxID=1883 RepID=A0ABP4BEU9_9ACTN
MKSHDPWVSACFRTGLLGRAQARMQLKAEHVRVLREPRRAAYSAFAECLQQIRTLHDAIGSQLAAAAAGAEDLQREESLQEALRVYQQAGDLFHGELQRLQSSVTVEGPPDVTKAALRAGSTLLYERGTLHRWIRFLEDGTAAEEHQRESDDANLAAQLEIVSFLNEASSALAYDGITPAS